jgi:hypothetical protein
MVKTYRAERALGHWQNVVAHLLFRRGMVNGRGWKKMIERILVFKLLKHRIRKTGIE